MSKQGRPYSVEELKGAASQPEDEYHRQLMRWAAQRLAALTRERDALTWQPIETAPRDSTPILVTGCNGGRVILYAQFFEERADEAFKGPGWLGCFEGMQMWLAEPTHWMPLPTPPEADTGGA